MIIKGREQNLRNNLHKQLSNYWADLDFSFIDEFIPKSIEIMEENLSATQKGKYIWQDDEVIFSPMHSVQYSVFLYFLSNLLYKNSRRGDTTEADSIYYLNKIMHSVDWFYAIELPVLFFAEHPLGSVLGRAKYGNRFFIYQGCTVGGNESKDGELSYPVIGDNVLMFANSSVLGKSIIGSNVILSAGTRIIGQDIPSNSIVFGQSPNLVIKSVSEQEIKQRYLHWRWE